MTEHISSNIDPDTPIPFKVAWPIESPADDEKDARRQAVYWKGRGFTAYPVGRPAFGADDHIEKVFWFCRVEGLSHD